MAQRFEQPVEQSDFHGRTETPIKFTFNEKNPAQSSVCEDTSCKLMSPSQFKSQYPQEYADYLKIHPEHRQRMEEFDKSNPAIRALPKTIILDMPQGRGIGGERVHPEATESGSSRGASRGVDKGESPTKRGTETFVIPLLKDGERPLKLDTHDPSVRLLPLDTGRGRDDLSPRSLRLDSNGRLQFDERNDLRFDPDRRLQFDENGRIQLRIRPDGSEFRNYNPDDPISLLRKDSDRLGNRDLFGRDSQRRNPFDDLMDPFSRNRNRDQDPFSRVLRFDRSRSHPLEDLLDPRWQRGGDSNGRYLNIPPLDSRLRLPGQQSGNLLNELYQKGGIRALPPQVREQVLQQLSTGEIQLVSGLEVPQPAKPPAKPPEKQPEKPPEPQADKPAEKPAEQPGKPIDGPKPPSDLERPVDASDSKEKLDAFGQAIKDTGAYTVDNFGQAYKDAAAAGSGIAIMVVGRGIPGSEEAIKNVKKLQEENPKLKFLIVDRDKVDATIQADPKNAKMQEWKNWIDQSVKACGGNDKNTVLTSVQSLKADASGYPVPEKVTSFHWNANINQELAAKASLASDATASRAQEFRLKMDASSAKALCDQIKAARDEALAAPFGDMNSMRDRHAKFVKALTAASQARPDLLAERRNEINKLTDEAQKKEQMSTLWELENASRLLRAELGLDMVRSAANLPTPEKRAAMTQAGIDVLKDAYRTAPELRENADFAAAIKSAGVNVDQLIKDSDNAQPVSSDQIRQKVEGAYSAGDPVRVTEKRTEYRANVPAEARARVMASNGSCYRDSCVRQQCCRPGGILRRFCGRR